MYRCPIIWTEFAVRSARCTPGEVAEWGFGVADYISGTTSTKPSRWWSQERYRRRELHCFKCITAPTVIQMWRKQSGRKDNPPPSGTEPATLGQRAQCSTVAQSVEHPARHPKDSRPGPRRRQAVTPSTPPPSHPHHNLYSVTPKTAQLMSPTPLATSCAGFR